MFSSDRCNPVTQTEESLPFRVEIASREQLQEVADLRAVTYGKHLPVLGALLSQPEPADTALGCEVFVARSKLDGSLLGTLRTHANMDKPLPLQASLNLPERFRGTRMVETTRLCIKGSPGASTVRSALFKAMHQYCLGQKVEWMLATARRHVDRIHDSLLFQDVKESRVYYPMAHVNGVPHRVMYMSTTDMQRQWRDCQHSLYRFAYDTYHPDIDITQAQDLSGYWNCTGTSLGASVTYLPERVPKAQEPAHYEPSRSMALVA